jgi:transposase InsO family protein
MMVEGALGIEPMCRLAGVSRAGFYRYLAERHPVDEDMEARSLIQQIALEHRRRYGYRRITAELNRRGMRINHKRVLRLMRADNLLSVAPGTFRSTTDSGHALEVYLNLARQLKLTGINQLWVADLTYLRLKSEFVYLALVLDAFSRKAVGWELGRSLTTRLPRLALEQAIARRNPPSGMVHHSDRGVQYASQEYMQVLHRRGLLPSMSRPANPYDNAACESFIKTLKREEIYAGRYQDLDDLRAHLAEFIDRYYNRQRLHSALGYRTPEEFEAFTSTASCWPGPSLSFPRHGECYRWDKKTAQPPQPATILEGGEPSQPSSPTHLIDEPPAGYSLTGWSPPEPVSASPAVHNSGANHEK